MSRSLWMALFAVGALSLYLMGSEGDDDLLAPAKERGSARAPAVVRTPGSAGRAVQAGQAGLDEQAISRWFIDGVMRWQARRGPADLQVEPVGAGALTAWAGVLPPAPEPPTMPAATAQPDAPPEAPPFALPWVGRFNDAGQASHIERAVLQGPRATLVVKVGDVIEGQWRIDGIHDRVMTVTYLPLNQPQTVAMK